MSAIIIFQLLFAFFIGFFGLFIIHRIVTWYLVRYQKIEEHDNLALSIIQMGIIASGSIILSDIVDPAVNAIRLLNPNDHFQVTTIGSALIYISLFAIIGITTTFVVIAGGLIAIFKVTKVNEIAGMKGKRLNSTLVAVALIIGISYIVSDYCGHLCEAFLPYPKLFQIK